MDGILLVTCFVLAVSMIFISIPFKIRIVCSILVGTLFFTASWSAMQTDRRLAREGVHTTGKVIAKSCGGKDGRNDKIEYQFIAGDKVVTGSGKPGYRNQPCTKIQIEDQLFITYLHSNPAISRPSAKVESSAFGLIFIAFVFTAGTFALNTIATKSKRSTKK